MSHLMYITNLSVVTLGLLSTLVVDPISLAWSQDLACCLSGLWGGTITQLLTMDHLRPTKKVIVGELIAAISCGFGVYAFSGIVAQTENFRQLLFVSTLVGSLGSAGFRKAVGYLRPSWLDSHTKKENNE